MIAEDPTVGSTPDWRLLQQQDILARKQARAVRIEKQIVETKDKVVTLEQELADVRLSIGKTEERIAKLNGRGPA